MVGKLPYICMELYSSNMDRLSEKDSWKFWWKFYGNYLAVTWKDLCILMEIKLKYNVHQYFLLNIGLGNG